VNARAAATPARDRSSDGTTLRVSVRAAVRPLRISASTAARRSAADRGGLAFTAGFDAMVVVVLAALWETATAAQGGEVAGYSAVALGWYVAMAEAAVVALDIRLIENIGRDIADGSITAERLRPVSVLAVRVATELGRALPRLAVCVVVGGGLALALRGAPPDGAALALAAPALVLAVAVNLVIQHAVAAAAFWVRNAGAGWFLYHKLVFVLGGMLIPLEVLPHGLEITAKVLPIMAVAYVPARLAAGHREPALLLVQAGWLVVCTALAAVVFTAGERRLRTVGG
jgi:ABC-2 type transport system permease protein